MNLQVKLALGAMVIGSLGGSVVTGYAATGETVTVKVRHMVKATDDDGNLVNWVYQQESQLGKIGEALRSNTDLSRFLTYSLRSFSEDSEIDWNYHSSLPAHVSVTYSADGRAVGGYESTGKLTKGGRVKLVAPAGYALMPGTAVLQMATKKNDKWTIPVVAIGGVAEGNGPVVDKEPEKPITERPPVLVPPVRPVLPPTINVPQPQPQPQPQPIPEEVPNKKPIPPVHPLPDWAESIDHEIAPITTVDADRPENEEGESGQPTKTSQKGPQAKPAHRRSHRSRSVKEQLPQTNEKRGLSGWWGLLVATILVSLASLRRLFR
ncbi:hypothetical protein [Levilactobacillus paucivorans]|nr:hypothetical protein [Levilactobacillus paucivorans]